MILQVHEALRSKVLVSTVGCRATKSTATTLTVKRKFMTSLAPSLWKDQSHRANNWAEIKRGRHPQGQRGHWHCLLRTDATRHHKQGYSQNSKETGEGRVRAGRAVWRHWGARQVGSPHFHADSVTRNLTRHKERSRGSRKVHPCSRGEAVTHKGHETLPGSFLQSLPLVKKPSSVRRAKILTLSPSGQVAGQPPCWPRTVSVLVPTVLYPRKKCHP